MRAHRVKVHISQSHELRLQLPSDFPPGKAELIVLETMEEGGAPVRKHTIDELLAGRLAPPPGVGPVTLPDMERAISEGAAGRGGA
jgi:hypothetical protein